MIYSNRNTKTGCIIAITILAFVIMNDGVCSADTSSDFEKKFSQMKTDFKAIQERQEATKLKKSSVSDFEEKFSQMKTDLNVLSRNHEVFIQLRGECANGNDDACVRIGLDPTDPCRRYFTANNELNVCHAQLLREVCVNGNDDACVRIGLNPADPCRRYFTANEELNACRIQQCADGNQAVCNSLRGRNITRKSSDRETEQNERNVEKRTCERNCFSDKTSCNRACSFSFGSSSDTNCDVNCRKDYDGCKSHCN